MNTLMKQVLLALTAAVGGTYVAEAQMLETDDGVLNWEGSVTAGLNTDGAQLDFGISYFPVSYFGLRMQVGLNGEIEMLRNWIFTDDYDDYYYDDSYASRFKFTASFDIRTPRLIHWKSQDAGIYLFAQPGLTLSPYDPGLVDAKWANWDFKCGINVQIDRFIATIGYGVTDFCLYSGHAPRAVSPDPDWWTHSLFIGGAYKF